MKKKILGIVISLVLLCSLIIGVAPIQADNTNDLDEDWACSSLAAGRLATVDGSVLFGHNEDNGNRHTLLHIVPRVYHEPEETITLKTGSVIDQVEGETWAYLWSELPGCTFSDTYLNEWGVAIASDNAGNMKGTTDYDLTQNGIGYWLRRLVPERAKTAREGVEIMGQFVEELGYTQGYHRSSAGGRNYIVADPNETWIFVVACGTYWGAQRVPDDEVAFVPNYITIREMDLDDTDNFLACSDLVQHAIDEGWCASPEMFDFAKAYNTEGTQTSLGNKLRHWGALRLLTGIEYPDMDDLPFSVKPNRLLSIEDIAEVLRCHYEGTVWEWNPTLGPNPHNYKIDGVTIRPICVRSTDESSIFQLRSWLPSFVGNIYWRSQCRPCPNVYIPWYYGILEIAEPYTIGGTNHDDPESAYWTFTKMVQLVDADYANRIGTVREVWDQMEAKAFARQDNIERTALTLYNIGGEHHEYLAKKFLTQYTEGLALKAFRFAHEFIELWEPGWAGVEEE